MGILMEVRTAKRVLHQTNVVWDTNHELETEVKRDAVYYGRYLSARPGAGRAYTFVFHYIYIL